MCIRLREEKKLKTPRRIARVLSMAVILCLLLTAVPLAAAPHPQKRALVGRPTADREPIIIIDGVKEAALATRSPWTPAAT
jgi:hypothetical protein